jgi:5-methyltetrahydrofolate--homocysteine methyltransferase
MSEELLINKIKEAIINIELQKAEEACISAVSKGIAPVEIIKKGIGEAVKVIGNKFESKEYFLPELIMSGEIIKDLMKILEPHIKNKNEIKSLGKIIIGTCKGDMHDIGKNIVKTFLETEGFEVVDLGVDVSAETFVDAVSKNKFIILAMSALLTMTMMEMEHVIKELKKKGLRNQIKIIIGGAPITPEFGKIIGADAYARDAIEGVKICKRWISQ